MKSSVFFTPGGLVWFVLLLCKAMIEYGTLQPGKKTSFAVLIKKSVKEQ